MKITCMMCGRVIEIEEFKKDPYDDDDEDEVPVKKTLCYCVICEAKIKNESDPAKKAPKPM